MNEPVVAIVGRPNVGKSTLVNRIIGARKAIVDDQPRVTRDRSYHPADWCGKDFFLVDTGGLVLDSDEPFDRLVNQQVDMAVDEADVIVFLVDGREGVTPMDEAVANRLRRCEKPVILGVNKIDTPQQAALTAEFYSLGLGDPLPVSAVHGFGGVGDLLDKIIEPFPEDETDEKADESSDEPVEIRMAIVGRPNVGKSSILNALTGKERAIVSDVSGTTRDSVEAVLSYEDALITVIDTAGIRKKRKVPYGIEMFSVDRAIQSLRDADVTVLVLDAVEGVTDQDKRIIDTSNKQGRGLVVVVNKWDQVPDKKPNSVDEFKEKLFQKLPHAMFARMLFTSAVSGQRIPQVLEAVREVYENANRRVSTSLVNQVIGEAVTLTPPPPIKSKTMRIFYATQATVGPPTFILFSNDAKLMKESYRRYLERKLRESFEFSGTPLKILVRTRRENK